MAKYYLYVSSIANGDNLYFTPYDTLEDAQKIGARVSNLEDVHILECKEDVLRYFKTRESKWDGEKFCHVWND